MKFNVYLSIILIGLILTGIVLTTKYFIDIQLDKDEAHSALFFTDYKSLPKTVHANDSFVISMTVTNNELNTVTYILEIEMNTLNFTIEPGEIKTIKYQFNPVDNRVQFSVTEQMNDKLSNIEDSRISAITDSKIHIKGYETYLPVSFSLGEQDDIYHVNMTLEDLKVKPFNRLLVYNSSKSTKQLNMTFYVKNDEIFLSAQKIETTRLSVMMPFIAKLYQLDSPKDDSAQILFWYSFV